MAVDGLHATRPVEFPVGRPEEAQGMFDVLTYQKGGSVLRMLEQFLGADVFRDGIHDYLLPKPREHRDLPTCGTRSSGRAGARCGRSWTPGSTRAAIRWSRWVTTARSPSRPSPTAASRAAPSDRDWQVPVLTRPLAGRDGGSEADPPAGPADHARRRRPEDWSTPGGSGYYRVSYPAPRSSSLAEVFGELAPLERYNLVSDAWAAALSGQAPLADLLRAGPGAGRRRPRAIRVSGRWCSGRSASSTGSCPTPTGPHWRGRARTLLGPAGRPPRLGAPAR